MVVDFRVWALNVCLLYGLRTCIDSDIVGSVCGFAGSIVIGNVIVDVARVRSVLMVYLRTGERCAGWGRNGGEGARGASGYVNVWMSVRHGVKRSL